MLERQPAHLRDRSLADVVRRASRARGCPLPGQAAPRDRDRHRRGRQPVADRRPQRGGALDRPRPLPGAAARPRHPARRRQPRAAAGAARALRAEGRTVDFVLVDGDHSREGVRRDLVDLLASPAISRTVILMHDTFNGEVRAGITDVDFAAYPAVALVELDMTGGYMAPHRSVRGPAVGRHRARRRRPRCRAAAGDLQPVPVRRLRAGRAARRQTPTARRMAPAAGWRDGFVSEQFGARDSGVDARALAIEVRDLHKAFRIPTAMDSTLKERRAHPFSRRELPRAEGARRDRFDVEQGEFFGIVGRNGSRQEHAAEAARRASTAPTRAHPDRRPAGPVHRARRRLQPRPHRARQRRPSTG